MCHFVLTCPESMTYSQFKSPNWNTVFLIWSSKHWYCLVFFSPSNNCNLLHTQAVWKTHTHTTAAFNYPAMNVLAAQNILLKKPTHRCSLLRRWSMFLSATHWKKPQRFTCLILDMKYYPHHSRKPRRLDAGTDSIHSFAIRNKQTNKKLFDLSPNTERTTDK